MKKILVLLLAFVMVFTIGCNKETTEKAEVTQGGSGLKPMEISIGFWDATDKFDLNDPVYKMFNEKFNVTFKGKGVSWSDYKEKYKLWAAADELPDIFAVDEINTKTYEDWISQQVIKALPQDLSKYPNLAKAMEQSDVTPLKKDGNYYMVPRMTYPSVDLWALDRAVVVRKDWLNALGLEIPKTYEDYKKVLNAFVNQDPDKNGKNDTLGLTHKSKDFLQVFFMGSVPQFTNQGWIEEDGQWIPAFYSKHVTTFVKQFKDLYDNNLLDQDFALLKTFDGTDKFAQGKVGMLATNANSPAIKDLRDRWNKFDHETSFEDAVMIIPAWSHEDGNTYSFTQTTYWSESYINGRVDDEKLERILMIYDFLKSPEFHMIKTYGLEGVDYTKEGDKITITRQKDENGTFSLLRDQYPSLYVLSDLAAWDQELTIQDNEINRSVYGDDSMDMIIEYMAYNKEHVTPAPVNFDVKLMSTPAKTELSAIRPFDDIIKVILGEEDVELSWQAVRAGYSDYNIEKAIEEVNAQMK